MPAVLAALVTALSLEAADHVLSLQAAIPPGARVALVVSANRAGESLGPATQLAAAGAGVTIVVEAPEAAAAAASLELKRTLTALRGGAPDISLGVAGPLSRLSILFEHDLAAYVDVAVVADADISQIEAIRLALRVSVWTSATLPADGTEANLAALAHAGADAVLVRPDTDARGPWLLATASRLNEAPAADIAESVTVIGARRLSAAEIVARHQAQAVRQHRLIQTLISSGHLRVTLEVPGFSAPVVIEADTTAMTAGTPTQAGPTEFAHRHIRVNGLEFDGTRMPRLPIIEPERVATPPLEITLTRAYRYSLEGVDDFQSPDLNGSARRCYVIAFGPDGGRESLYRGHACIDAKTFGLVRLEAAQTNLRGSIVSSEQIDEYGPVPLTSGPSTPASEVWLLSRSDVRQLYEGPGFRTPIRRLLVLDRHDVNPPDYAARRASVHASDAVLLRDTPNGYRYLKPEPGGRKPGTEGQESAVRTEIGRAPTRVPTVVFGVLVDPNITHPLPFAGLNYADFDLFGTGAQFNGFFGGTYGQAAWSIPSVGGSRWQLAGSAFAVLARYHDRAFIRGRERYDENLLQRPAHADVALVRPLSPRVAFRVGYDLVHTDFDRAESTDPGFQVPPSQWAHGLRVELQAQRAGWTLAGWWSPAKRLGWRPWGFQGAQGAQDVFHRWGASVARTMLLSRSLTGRVEAMYMDGRDLDRFSRYAFGTFDNRLKGYPSASVRFERGGVGRTAVAWQAGRRLRLDGFFDVAVVQDWTFGRRGRGYAGIGAAVETPLPFGLLGGVEWGHGFQGVNADGSLGTHVVRVTAFKIF
jgi:hypothetical protein